MNYELLSSAHNIIALSSLGITSSAVNNAYKCCSMIYKACHRDLQVSHRSQRNITSDSPSKHLNTVRKFISEVSFQTLYYGVQYIIWEIDWRKCILELPWNLKTFQVAKETFGIDQWQHDKHNHSESFLCT